MTKQKMQTATNKGFTLIETIVYIGLFSLIFTGIFVSIYPIFTGAERLTRNIAGEGETVFVLAKIEYALGNVIVDDLGIITSPAEGTTANTLTLAYNGTERFSFAENNTNTFCTAPLLCHTLTESTDSGDDLPLNTQRVSIQNFSVNHVAPTSNSSRYIDVSFTVNDSPVGPIRYYVHF